MAQATTHALPSRLVGGRRVVATRGATIDRGLAAAWCLGALPVLWLGLTDGGYYGRSSGALTLAFAATSALGAIQGGRVSRRGYGVLALLAALTAWTALSASWARSGALVENEVRRTLLYALAVAAVLLVADARRRRALLLGALAAISSIGLVAVCLRAASGEVVDRFYGTLLEEPVGYPNALGVLAALGVVLAVGLTSRSATGARALRATATFLVLVLGLTGSRGAVVALAAGLCFLVALRPAGERLDSALGALAILVLGGATWVATVHADGGGAVLVGGAVAALLAGALTPAPTRIPRRRALGALASCAVAAGLALALLEPVATTSSFRTAYWTAALGEARAHPTLGSGAGSFHLAWDERGSEGMFVRDAHSLYVEALSELGPVGLALVVALVALPLAAAIRERGDPLVAVAGAGFVVFAVHAGLDWDWEMPVVTLVGLGCAAVVLVKRPSRETHATK